jgi:type 1 fimbria pilin
MRRFAIGAAGALLLLTLASAPAFASSNGSISVSPSTIAPGGTIHVSGTVDPSACTTSDAATLTGLDGLFPPDGFGPSAQRDAQGAFSLDYTVPTTTPAGDYRIGVRCGGGNVGVFATLTVAGAPIGGAATGAGGAAGSALPWTVVGLGSLTLAALLVAVRRRSARSV